MRGRRRPSRSHFSGRLLRVRLSWSCALLCPLPFWFFRGAFERVERFGPELIEVLAERVESGWIQLVNAIAALPALAHDARLSEDAQVLRDRRPADVEMLGELVHAVRPAEQVLEHRATRRVGHRSKRVGRIGNHMVTYYLNEATTSQLIKLRSITLSLLRVSCCRDMEFTRRKPQRRRFA